MLRISIFIHQLIPFTLPPAILIYLFLFAPWGYLWLADLLAGILPTNGRGILKPLQTATATAPTGVLVYNQNGEEDYVYILSYEGKPLWWTLRVLYICLTWMIDFRTIWIRVCNISFRLGIFANRKWVLDPINAPTRYTPSNIDVSIRVLR